MVGEIVHDQSLRSTADDVTDYLAIRLQSGKVLEAITFQCDQRTMVLYNQGDIFGRIVEKALPEPKSWWRRFLGPRERLWHLYLRDDFVAVIQMRYPVHSWTVLHMQLHNGETLPITLASTLFQSDTSFVIPPATPLARSTDVEHMHFLVSAVIRNVFSLDLS